MIAVNSDHQRTAFNEPVFNGLVFRKLRAVPGKNNIIFILQEPCGEKICVPTVAGDEDIRIFIMEETQGVGKIASLKAFCISDPQGSYHTG